MISSKRIIAVFAVMIIMASILAVQLTTATAASGDRRETGNGSTLRFAAGQSVAGEIITLRNSDGSWGRTWYRCKLADAPRKGRVTSGVIEGFAQEVKNLPNCKDTLSSPTPRRETGSGNWKQFQKGWHALGYAIETQEGPYGRTYFDCAIKKAPIAGFVISGVVNPSRFELRSMTACETTTTWRPGIRTESGDGSLPFTAGDYIVAAHVTYADGSVANGGAACHTIAPQNGTLYGGVRNYWPGEEGSTPSC